MNNLPNLSDFKVFCVVAKRRSFVESAEELGSSPAYVSKRINILETNLNCKLFIEVRAMLASRRMAN